MAIGTDRVGRLLNPRSIALVGASDTSPWAQGFVKNIHAFGAFPGPVHMVNPRRAEAFGQVCYPSVQAIPEQVDHAAVLVAAKRVLSVLKDCAAAGVRSATVIASGFEEAGPEGKRLSDEIAAFCAAVGIAIIGPNCYGFNNYNGIFISRYNITVPPAQGNIGFSFQSGQLGAATADAAYARGIKLAYAVSSGNEVVVDWNDYQEFFLEDPQIKVLGGVIERIPDPDRFASIARRALAAGKPIVLLKPGKSEAASRIAVAHTGSATGSDAITGAFLRDLGIIRVESVEELAETAGLLAKRGVPSGPRTAFVGFSGGAAELFAEQADGTSLVVEEHGADTRRRLAEASTLPESAIHNPLDMTVDGAVHFAEIIDVLANSDDIDIIVSQGQAMRTEDLDNNVFSEFRDAHELALFPVAEASGKYACFLETGDTQPGVGAYLYEPKVNAIYVLGQNGVKALSNSAWYATQREWLLTEERPGEVEVAELPDLTGRSGALSEPESKALLRAYGIPVTTDIEAATVEEAVAAADQIGYPVVMKVIAPNVPHKSDAGGVRVGVADAQAVRASFEEIRRDVLAHVADARIAGVVVAQQVKGAKEFLAGVTTDQNLGPAVVAGLGGVYVEVFNDVALATPPVSPARAEAAIRSLRSARLLEGVRGDRPLDIAAYADVLVRLGRLTEDLGDRLVELDINPLFVREAPLGVVAADALVILR